MYIIIILLLTVIVIVYSISIMFNMYTNGAIYNKKNEECKINEKFCNIRTDLKISVPDDLKKTLLKMVYDNNGTRINVFKWKSGRSLSTKDLIEIPGFKNFYEDILCTKVGEAVSKKVYPTDYSLSTTCTILVYEKKNDYINWHYDVNYYNGKFYTLIVPLTLHKTCTNFKYKLDGKDYVVKETDNILFEGEKLFHMATQQCDNNIRAVLAFQFVTSNEINKTKYALLKIKDSFAYTGLSFNDYKIWFIRILHTFIYMCFSLYVFVFIKTEYDIVYLTLFILMILHWCLFRGDCILDYYEKKLLFPNYNLGDDIYNHIYLDLIHPKLIIFLNIMIMINIVIIIYRSKIKNNIIKIILILFIVLLMIKNEISRNISLM